MTIDLFREGSPASRFREAGPMEKSGRMQLITQILDDHQIEWEEVQSFFENNKENLGKLWMPKSLLFPVSNIIVKANDWQEDRPTRAMTAHYDIVNARSQNANDNTASICLLLELLIHGNWPDTHNWVVAFTDFEEIGGHGAVKLSDWLPEDTEWVLNLDMSLDGDTIFMEPITSSKLYKAAKDLPFPLVESYLPPQDAVPLRNCGQDSICFGLVVEDELKSAYPRCWMTAHSEADQWQNAKPDSMLMLLNFCHQMIWS